MRRVVVRTRQRTRTVLPFFPNDLLVLAPGLARMAVRIRQAEVVRPGLAAGLPRAGGASPRRHRTGRGASLGARRATGAPTFRLPRERLFPVAHSLPLPGRLAYPVPADG